MKPPFVSVPLADGLRWRGGNGWRFEEKMDGMFHVEQLPGWTLIGEVMRDGRFFAFDITRYYGQDLSALPLSRRLEALDGLGVLRPAVGSGGEFLEAVLARGGEGVVAKRLDSPYGATWHKCKRTQVFYCRVTDLDPFRGSVVMVDRDTNEPRGKMALRSRFEQVRVGSILKVEAYGLTGKGLLREARPDHDAPGSWLQAF